MYQPTNAVITNPLLKGDLRPVIGQTCEIVKLQPDYGGIMDLVYFYGDMMAICATGAAMNTENSKLAYAFAVSGKTGADSFKKMYDNIQGGNPASFVAKKDLYDMNGNPRWILFSQNVGQNYITDKVLNDLATIENQFNTRMGIPNANTQKRERLITDEVNANNSDTKSIPEMIIENVSETMAKANDMFGLNLGIKYRWEAATYEQESISDN